MAWYVVQTTWKSEIATGEELLKRGFLPLVPTEIVDSGFGAARRETVRPVFAGYVFVEFDTRLDAWQQINEMKTVRRVMCYPQTVEPFVLPDESALRLYDLYGNGPIRVDKTVARKALAGQKVQVCDGPFMGKIGPCVRVTGPRAEVLLYVFGGMMSVAVDVVALRVVGEPLPGAADAGAGAAKGTPVARGKRWTNTRSARAESAPRAVAV